MMTEISIDDILQDLQAIDPIILQYEQKYRLLSPYFYKLYQAGKLEERWDFMDWAALYEIKLDREKEYQQRFSEVLKYLPLEQVVETDTLIIE